MRHLRLGLVFALSLTASAQTLTTTSLTGRYFARHVEFTIDPGNNVTDARSIEGYINFTGSGSYSFVGQQVIGTGAAATFSASGTYSVSPAGLVTLTNPQKNTLNINARFATEAVIGASTEAPDNTFDFFVAIPYLSAPVNTLLTGTFYATDFELTAAATSQVRDSFVNMQFDGAGNVTSAAVLGHAANLSGGSIASQVSTGGAYSVPGGTITLPGATLLGAAQRVLAVSSSGNVFIAATPGAHDLMIGVKAIAAAATGSSLTPTFWLGGLRVDSAGAAEDFAGSGVTINSVSITSTQRLHETGLAAALDVTESNPYTLAADGTGSYGPSKIGLGTGGTLLVTANLSAVLDPTGYQIGFAVMNPALSGPSVFISPRGVVNAASGAPGVESISPGEFIAIYGSGLAAATTIALPPYPNQVGNVSVTIGGIQAPIYFVSAGQIDCLVPYAVTGASVNISVNNNGSLSNTVSVPLAKTSPGIFALDSTGTGDGALLHLNNSIVNAANPAKKGEIIQIYLTGLGALTNPIADGHGATAADFAVTPIAIYVDGILVPPSGLLYDGVSSFPGLYQINFVVPNNVPDSGELPLSILTSDAFHDQVNIAVQ